MFTTVRYGYKCILQKKAAMKVDQKHQVFQLQSVENGAKLRSEVFDSDSDTIIVDNSANCIIWRHKKNFVPESYVAIALNEAFGVTSAVRKGQLFNSSVQYIQYYVQNLSVQKGLTTKMSCKS